MKPPMLPYQPLRLPPRKESEISRAILAYLALVPGVVAWRTNSGMAMMRSGKTGPMVPVRFGFKGISDILGWRSAVYTYDCLNGSCGWRPIQAAHGHGEMIARFLAIEVKVPGKKPTREQAAFLDRVRTAGGIALVASSVDDVRKILNP